MGLAINGQLHLAIGNEKHRLGTVFRLGGITAATGADFNNILRKSLGKAREWARQNPRACVVPMGQV